MFIKEFPKFIRHCAFCVSYGLLSRLFFEKFHCLFHFIMAPPPTLPPYFFFNQTAAPLLLCSPPEMYCPPSRIIIVPLIIGDCTVTKNKVKLWDFFYSLTRTKSTCFDNAIRNRKLFCFILFYRKHHLP